MARLSIELPEGLRLQAQARAAEAGHASLEEYVTALIRADASASDTDPGAPEHLTVATRAALEAELLEGLASPAGEMTADDWEELRRAVDRGRAP